MNSRQQKHRKHSFNQKQLQTKCYYQGFCLACSLCEDYICNTATTRCDHHFYQCPICHSQLRKYKLSANILVDNLISSYIKVFDPDAQKEFSRRCIQAKIDKHNMSLPQQIKINSKIDVRDQNFIWVQGKILKKIDRKDIDGKVLSMLRVRIESMDLKQENILLNSERLASLGFYTQREGLPRYSKQKKVLYDWQNNCEYILDDLKSTHF